MMCKYFSSKVRSFAAKAKLFSFCAEQDDVYMPKSISKDDLKDIRKPQVVNLKFLDRFIKTMKWTKPQFAEMIGMTKANVYHWFKVDDIQLTTLNSAFEKIGYEEVFSMDMPQKKLGIDVETIDYWFRHDKCYISYFFSIARYTGMKLKIDIKPTK